MARRELLKYSLTILLGLSVIGAIKAAGVRYWVVTAFDLGSGRRIIFKDRMVWDVGPPLYCDISIDGKLTGRSACVFRWPDFPCSAEIGRNGSIVGFFGAGQDKPFFVHDFATGEWWSHDDSEPQDLLARFNAQRAGGTKVQPDRFIWDNVWPPMSCCSLPLLLAVTMYLWGADLVIHIRNWQAKRREGQPPQCEACGYNLTGNTSGRCPECGRPIPDDHDAL